MKRYIGTKLINAVAMTRLAYNEMRGWKLPEDENGDDEGYLVEYVDGEKNGGKKNHPDFNGYISWSPKGVFDSAYRPIDSMTFGLAIEALKAGKKVARAGWNGRGMYVRFVDTTESLNRHFELLNVAGTFDTWVASVSDTLAEDWQIV
jgi:hypothetical protein